MIIDSIFHMHCKYGNYYAFLIVNPLESVFLETHFPYLDLQNLM